MDKDKIYQLGLDKRDKKIMDSWEELNNRLNKPFASGESYRGYVKSRLKAEGKLQTRIETVHGDILASPLSQTSKEDSANEELKEMENNEIDEIALMNAKVRELKKERIKVQTEKLELTQLLREQSRVEMFEEKVLQAMKELKPVKIPNVNIVANNTNRDMILGIADMHFGKELVIHGLKGEVLNAYNPQIFEERMWKLLEETIIVLKKEGLTHINVVNLSDSLEGMLRVSQLMSLKFGFIDTTIYFANFLTNWLNELSKYALIDYYSVNGNHNDIRILTGKKGDFPNENLERIINWYLYTALLQNKNINIHRNDKGIEYFNTIGINVLMVHGHNESNLENSIRDYNLLYGQPIDILLSGHLHTSHEKSVGMGANGNQEYIQFPSIIGIDDYSMHLKKASRAGSKIIILEEKKGKSIVYDIKLN